jgi:6-phosphogluconolactonase
MTARLALDPMIALTLIPIVFAAVLFGQSPSSNAAESVRVYVGTVSGKNGGKGIYRCELDLHSGKLSQPVLAVETVNPAFLAIRPDRKFLYAVGQPGQDRGVPGAITAFAIDPSNGDLTRLNQESTGGPGPCFVTVDRTGRNALIANYSGGSCGVLPIADDGSLKPMSSFMQHEGKGTNPQRQDAPHAHSINLDASNHFAFVPDLGLDKVVSYRLDPSAGTLVANNPPSASVAPGAGPRHFTFHPDGRHAYVINELACTVTAFNYDPQRGALDMVQTVSTLPSGVKPEDFKNTTAEVLVHPSGKFVYGSNRGHNTIAIFAVDPSTAQLTPIGHQGSGIKTPRNFNIDPTGQWMLVGNLDGDNINVFRIDPQSGMLQPVGEPVPVPKPMCIKFWQPAA